VTNRPASHAYPPADSRPLSYLPVDTLRQVRQDGTAMNESEKQFSFTRAASSTCGRAKSKFLSAKVKSGCSEGGSPSGLAESRRNLERKN
jgi:hypothetical protein